MTEEERVQGFSTRAGGLNFAAVHLVRCIVHTHTHTYITCIHTYIHIIQILTQELYEPKQCLFLLEESDSLQAYESRAQPRPSSHEAAFAALGGLGHVQQVEAIHRT